MNQKGFANIIWVLIIVVLAGIVGYFVFTKQQSSKGALATYQNKELGISFKHPSDLKVYQQDENSILIKSDYKNPEHSAIEISMNIKRTSFQRETKEQIEAKFKGLPEEAIAPYAIIKQETKGNYELLQMKAGSQYYILSDKGTFYVGDTVDTFGWKEIFTKEGIYQTYRSKFDAIRNSIKID